MSLQQNNYFVLFSYYKNINNLDSWNNKHIRKIIHNTSTLDNHWPTLLSQWTLKLVKKIIFITYISICLFLSIVSYPFVISYYKDIVINIGLLTIYLASHTFHFDTLKGNAYCFLRVNVCKFLTSVSISKPCCLSN